MRQIRTIAKHRSRTKQQRKKLGGRGYTCSAMYMNAIQQHAVEFRQKKNAVEDHFRSLIGFENYRWRVWLKFSSIISWHFFSKDFMWLSKLLVVTLSTIYVLFSFHHIQTNTFLHTFTFVRRMQKASFLILCLPHTNAIFRFFRCCCRNGFYRLLIAARSI